MTAVPRNLEDIGAVTDETSLLLVAAVLLALAVGLALFLWR